MTPSECAALFDLDQYEDLEEAYDFKLFELKQFLLSKVPFVKTYSSRLKQIEKMQEAFILLGGEEKQGIAKVDVEISSAGDLLSCWNIHQEKIRDWKKRVGQLQSLSDLKALMEERLETYKWYAENWVNITGRVTSDLEVKASVELDPMDVFQAIKMTVDNYQDNLVLQKESKRLILWLKLNGYE